MKFPAKILLFGEFTLIKGSQGLAIPFERYSCELTYDKADVLADSRMILQKIYDYICDNASLAKLFDLERMQSDIEKGLQIKMDIPIGYGLGSSGALTACVYEQYARIKEGNINQLQVVLGELESVFHGKSSGLDPLVSYLKSGIRIDENQVNHQIDFSLDFDDEFHLFLVDTREKRSTAPLVNSFIDRCKDNQYLEVVLNKFNPLINKVITCLIKEKNEQIYSLFKQLSILQLQYFDSHILEVHKKIWMQGIKSDDFYLKICGAGGGGFMLGITKDKEKVKATFDEKDLIWI